MTFAIHLAFYNPRWPPRGTKIYINFVHNLYTKYSRMVMEVWKTRAHSFALFSLAVQSRILQTYLDKIAQLPRFARETVKVVPSTYMRAN